MQNTPVQQTPFNVPEIRRASGAKAEPPKHIDAWSFSRWETYQSCPLLAKFKFIDKLREPDNEAQARGTAIHSKAQAFLERRDPELATELSQFPTEFLELRASAPHCEEQWAFNRSWGSAGWFAKGVDGAWCRVKMDAFALIEGGSVLRIVDFKTGKRRDSHDTQLELYGLSGLLKFPVDAVIAEDWYLDQGTSSVKTFDASERELLRSTWNDRVAPMFADTRFCANPSRRCAWCHFSASKGGPCKW